MVEWKLWDVTKTYFSVPHRISLEAVRKDIGHNYQSPERIQTGYLGNMSNMHHHHSDHLSIQCLTQERASNGKSYETDSVSVALYTKKQTLLNGYVKQREKQFYLPPFPDRLKLLVAESPRFSFRVNSNSIKLIK
jgi:hypothetical protein